MFPVAEWSTCRLGGVNDSRRNDGAVQQWVEADEAKHIGASQLIPVFARHRRGTTQRTPVRPVELLARDAAESVGTGTFTALLRHGACRSANSASRRRAALPGTHGASSTVREVAARVWRATVSIASV